MMVDLKGKTALLTGGSKGLGPYIGRALAEEKMNVALAARSEDALREAANDISSLGVRTLAAAADVTDESSVRQMLVRVRDEFGSIDVLVNNAGIEWVSAYRHLEVAAIRNMIATNLMAPMCLTRLVLPEMIQQGRGHIVTMSSLGGKKGSPYSATYAATKAGLIEWTRGLREELRGSGVGASVICPGFVAKAGMFAVYNKKAPRLVGETTPEKVAEAVVRSIKKNIGEIVVNSSPVRPMMFLDAVHPGIMSWVLRTFGVYGFYRKQAQDNQQLLLERKTGGLK